MQDFRLEEGPPLRSTRKLGNLSGSKPKFHSHSEVYQRITRASVRRDNVAHGKAVALVAVGT